MPQLDPRADLSAIQLVHPMIGRRELLDLYLEVYKLHQLPGSPLGEPAILQEILSAISDTTSEEEQSASAQRSSSHQDLCPSEDRHPCQERRRALDRSLARVHKVHWQVLSTMATLEEEIERLCQIKVRSTPERRPRSETQRRLDRRRKRWHQDSFANQSTPSQSIELDMHQGGTGSEGRESDLGDLPELKAEVASFLQGSSETSCDEDPPLELPMSRPADWVQWRAKECNLPTWWRELTAILGEDMERLAKEVRASFQFPWCRHEFDPKEAPYHAPPAPSCLNQQRFMPPPQSIYASQDIREIPREKAVAYARALQYYAEQSDPQKRCQPCLLAESVVEVREEIGFYLAFQDEEVFWGLDLPKEEGTHPIIAAAAVTEMEDITDIPEVSPALEAASKYGSWETVLHPSRPVHVAGEMPPPTSIPKPKGRFWVLSQTAPATLPSCLLRTLLVPTSSPLSKALASVRPPTPPRGFTDVTSCLKAPEFVEIDSDTPVSPMLIGLVATPGISSVSSKRVMKDDTMGLVYMDTVTTSVG